MTLARLTPPHVGTNPGPKVVVFPSDKPPPRIDKPEPGELYLWFENSKMSIFQNGTWFITPYFV
jgi:hypothetical protein